MIELAELTEDDLKLFSEFQRITGIYPLDCIITEFSIVFIVQNKGELYKAIGKKASNLPRLNDVFRKQVFIFVDSKDVDEFIRNAFSGVEIVAIKKEEKHDGKQYITLVVHEKDRGRAIGKEGRRIKSVKEILYRRMGIGGFQLRTTKQIQPSEDI
ncbi:NusA-like transcription termination signal-binding factor [Candidatus Micrarchaeota archaeon]|nr:NusA-like transcription termination signal-binding factor [Candidatus Micrarchaeota archaeon]